MAKVHGQPLCDRPLLRRRVRLIMLLMDTDKTALLFGPYKPPILKVGDVASCLYRDAEVVIYDWTMAPIPWPLCYHVGTRAFGKGLLIEEELARAIRHESAAALAHWWGVSGATVRTWRATFGVRRMDTEGSRRIIHNAALGGLNARRKFSGGAVTIWSAEERELLRLLPDEEVVRRTGRTLTAVMRMRSLLKLSAERQ